MAVFGAALLFPAAGQAPAPAFRAPRTPFGQPNLMGIWQAMSSAHYNLEPHAASLGVPAGVGVIVDPPDGKIPYTPQALAQRNANFKNRATADPHGKCYKPGTPHIIYLPFPFQIIQSPAQITILSEYVHNARTLFLNRSSHWPPDSVELWNGDSVAKWDGDTLVTDVANFGGQAWLDRAGNFTSEQLKVVERFTLLDADTIRYEATLTDPKTYTRPWTLRVLLYRHKEPNFRILEYECQAYGEDSLKEPRLPVVQ
ncbi:MAG: hypothetical protein HYU27_04415 [Acidobacteria bacterium]|nr:hypothetical protein [Acidobacteriota bacterium]